MHRDSINYWICVCMMHVQNNNNGHNNNICASTQVGVHVRGIYTYIKKAR